MRALRDMNLPKFVFEDVPLFLGLIQDLFPGLDCPRVRYPNFNDAVEGVLVDNGNILLPQQVWQYNTYTIASTLLYDRLILAISIIVTFLCHLTVQVFLYAQFFCSPGEQSCSSTQLIMIIIIIIIKMMMIMIIIIMIRIIMIIIIILIIMMILIIIIIMIIIIMIIIMIIIIIIIIIITATLMAFVFSIESFPLSGGQGCSALRDDVDSSHDDDRRPDRRRKIGGHQHAGPGPNSPRCHHEDAYDKPQRQERGRTLRNPGPEHSGLDRRTPLEYLPGDQPTDGQEWKALYRIRRRCRCIVGREHELGDGRQ